MRLCDEVLCLLTQRLGVHEAFGERSFSIPASRSSSVLSVPDNTLRNLYPDVRHFSRQERQPSHPRPVPSVQVERRYCVGPLVSLKL